jgi:hypothetical protein
VAGSHDHSRALPCSSRSCCCVANTSHGHSEAAYAALVLGHSVAGTRAASLCLPPCFPSTHVFVFLYRPCDAMRASACVDASLGVDACLLACACVRACAWRRACAWMRACACVRACLCVDACLCVRARAALACVHPDVAPCSTVGTVPALCKPHYFLCSPHFWISHLSMSSPRSRPLPSRLPASATPIYCTSSLAHACNPKRARMLVRMMCVDLCHSYRGPRQAIFCVCEEQILFRRDPI